MPRDWGPQCRPRSAQAPELALQEARILLLLSPRLPLKIKGLLPLHFLMNCFWLRLFLRVLLLKIALVKALVRAM